MREDEVGFSAFSIAIICSTALLAGISRTAVPGLGVLLTSLVAQVMPVRASTGFLLLILVIADIMAAVYWRRIIAWQNILRLLPWTVVGILIGYFLMGVMKESLFKPLLGIMVLVFVVLDFVRRGFGIELKVKNRLFIALMGILVGVSTMMANAAGPIMTIYLLSMDLPKEDFLGTNAWFFFIVNIIKIPFSVSLGLITWNYLKIDLMLVPIIFLGGVLGVFAIRKIPQKAFDLIVKVLAAVAGFKLLF